MKGTYSKKNSPDELLHLQVMRKRRFRHLLHLGCSSQQWLKVKARLLLCLFALFIVLFAYFLTRLEPDAVSKEALKSYHWEDPSQSKLREKVQAKRAAFARIEQIGEIQESDLSLLEQAYQLQEEIIEQNGGSYLGDLQVQTELRKQLHTLKGQLISEESQRLERQGRQHLSKEQIKPARTLFSQALTLQKKINERLPASDYVNTHREVALKRLILQIDTKPLFEKSLANEKVARQAIEKEQWEVAYKLLQQAIKQQYALNRYNPPSQYASSQRLQSLNRLLHSLQAAPNYLKIQSLLAQAQTKEEQGNYTKAVIPYQKAKELQKELNQTFPQSRFASANALQQINSDLQNASSYEVAQTLLAEIQQLDELIRLAQVDAVANQAALLKQRYEELMQAYPHNNWLDAVHLEKLTYLAYRFSVLKRVQREALDHLVQHPHNGDWQVSQFEVNQSLYQQIMGDNPSLHRSPRAPVTSLTWTEAQRFCERLGWLLGQTVKLPDASLFSNSLETLPVKLIQELWVTTHSEQRPKRVDSPSLAHDGFYGLINNVAEWIDGEPREGALNTEYGWIAGGHAIQYRSKQPRQLFSPVLKTERHPLTGFRFMVKQLPQDLKDTF